MSTPNAANVASWRRSTWLAPIVLGIASIVGLVSALVGDGAWDAVSWIGLGLPIAAGVWYGWRSAPSAARSPIVHHDGPAA